MIQHNAALLRFCPIPQTTISGPLRVEQTHPFAGPLGGMHGHHQRALCDFSHVAANRSKFAGRNPVNVMKLNKIERNPEKTALDFLCLMRPLMLQLLKIRPFKLKHQSASFVAFGAKS